MKSHGILPEGLTHEAVHRGTVVAISREGVPLVRAAGLAAPVACDVLDTGWGALEYPLGQMVVFVTYADHPEAGCILGAIATKGQDAVTVRRQSLRLEVEQFVLKAREASFETDHARIRMDRAGTLELVARTLVSRARRLQKLLAPILRLN